MDNKSNKLSEIDNRNPFGVPENYFVQFNDNIMKLLPQKEAVNTKTVSMLDRVKPWVYMAAMFLGIFFTIQLLTKSGANQDDNRSSTAQSISRLADDYWSNVQMSEEEFYQYLEDRLVRDGYYDYMYNQVNMN